MRAAVSADFLPTTATNPDEPERAAQTSAGAKQTRLSPDERRREFVAKATEFFSEEGFGGGTRALARRLGVTQPLLYRYFPSKDDLIKEVYRTVYLDPLETGWEKLLTDRSRPLRDRLLEFYRAYTDAIFTRKWLRIYLYSGLKGLDINRWYVGMVKDKILTRIIRECRHEVGLAVQSKPSAAELELAWVFHGGIFYYGVRKYIYESPVLEDKERIIADALDVFLAGFERVNETSADDPARARSRWWVELSWLFPGHFCAIPVTDLACGHQRYAVMADDVVEQRFQVFDAVWHARNIGVNRDRHDPRVRCAFEI